MHACMHAMPQPSASCRHLTFLTANFINELHLTNEVDLEINQSMSNQFNEIFLCFIFPFAVILSCQVSLRRSDRVCVCVWDSCQTAVLLVPSLSNHGPDHVIAIIQEHYPTVCARGLVLERQNKYVKFCRTFWLQNDSSHRLPTAVLQSSDNMHHYYYWTRGKIKMGFCWSLIACVSLTEHFLTYLSALRWFPFISKKIMLIVSSIIQCFYWICMFVWQIFKCFNMFLSLFIS